MIFSTVTPTPQYPHTAVIHPFELTPDGNHVGWQTAERLGIFEQTVKGGPYNISAVVLTAGYPPSLTRRHPGQRRTLARMMQEWLLERQVLPAECIHVSDNPLVWTSRGEILEAVHMIEERGLSRNLLVISTWNHVYPRLFITWKILLAMRAEWHVRFASATTCHVPVMHELAGTLFYVAWAIRQRARRMRSQST